MNPNPGMSGQFAVPRMVHSKSMPAEGAEAAGELPKLGSTVILSADDSKIIRGIIRHAGEVQFTSGVWVGVELSEAIGKNDGSVKGVQYFSCNPQHGIFVRPTMVFPPDQEAELLAKLNVLKNQQRLSDPAVIPPEPLESPLRVRRRLQNVVKRIGGGLTGAVRKSDPNLLASAGAISFMVSVTRSPGTPLGVDVVARERVVKVFGVREGPVTRWNDENPEQQMQTGDIIVEVNGEQGSGEELLGMMKRSYALELQVFRESDKTPDQISRSPVPAVPEIASPSQQGSAKARKRSSAKKRANSKGVDRAAEGTPISPTYKHTRDLSRDKPPQTLLEKKAQTERDVAQKFYDRADSRAPLDRVEAGTKVAPRQSEKQAASPSPAGKGKGKGKRKSMSPRGTPAADAPTPGEASQPQAGTASKRRLSKKKRQAEAKKKAATEESSPAAASASPKGAAAKWAAFTGSDDDQPIEVTPLSIADIAVASGAARKLGRQSTWGNAKAASRHSVSEEWAPIIVDTSEVQYRLALAMEEGDEEELRIVIPMAMRSGLPKPEIEAARKVLLLGMISSTLQEVKEVESTVTRLAEAPIFNGAIDLADLPVVPTEEPTLLEVRLEEKLLERLETKIETAVQDVISNALFSLGLGTGNLACH